MRIYNQEEFDYEILPVKIKTMNSVALITGGFDPLHSGHLALIKSAKEMSLLVAVGLNSGCMVVS